MNIQILNHLEELMPARLRFRDQEWELKAGMTVRDAILKMEIQPDAVLITRCGELITDDELLREGDEIKLIGVISGG